MTAHEVDAVEGDTLVHPLRSHFDGVTLHRATGGSNITTIFGPPPVAEVQCADCAAGRPQAFRVDVPPDRVIEAHFHPADQFQVFVAGAGWAGRQQLVPGTTHYVDRDTPYGPLEPGEDGLSFIAIRAYGNADTAHMPGARALLAERLAAGERVPSDRRELAFGPDDLFGEPGTRRCARSDQDGLEIVGIRLRPDEQLDAPVAGAGGRVLLVLDGTVAGRAGAIHPEGSVAFTPPGHQMPGITAGRGGASVLELQFPLADRVEEGVLT